MKTIQGDLIVLALEGRFEVIIHGCNCHCTMGVKIVKHHFSGKRIGYPLIGAGLAGGDWGAISAIIDEELAGEDHTLVEFVSG